MQRSKDACYYLACSALRTSGMTLPHQPLTKKIPHRLAYRPVDGGFFSVKVPSSYMTPVCVTVAKG